jgi:hypothetical protein
MTRYLQFLTIRENRLVEFTHVVSTAIGVKMSVDGFIPVKGCGFNACEHVVDLLNQKLYGEYTASGEKPITGGYL